MKDTIEDFVSKIEMELEDIPKGTLKPDTNYRSIESWGSMHALIVIAFLETEYNVTVNGEDLRSCNTLRELYKLASERNS